MKIIIIAACDINGGISKEGKMPWNIKEDMEHFRKMTTGPNKAVLMGSKTFYSIGNILKGRLNIVLTRKNTIGNKNIYYVNSLDSLFYNRHINNDDNNIIDICHKNNIEFLYVIGGKNVYNQFIKNKFFDEIYLTKIYKNYNCDLFIDWHSEIEKFTILESEKNIEQPIEHKNKKQKIEDDSLIIIKHYKKYNKEEYQYLNLIKEIIDLPIKKCRNNYNVRSKFVHTMRFSLENDQFPLLTTKKCFIRGIFEELMWFLSGSTNSKILESKGVNIWKQNSSREFLDSVGLNKLPEGDIGALYGFQWRHYGANYINCNTDYTGQGFDQIKDIIHKLKHDKTSRRIILCAWNSSDMDKMSICPCHAFIQFNVSSKGELSCHLVQRSADIGLGVPFNIASYALLTILLAKCTGLKPYELIHTLNDAHIYEDHILALKEQIQREPYNFPKLTVKSAVDINDNDAIFKFKYEDIDLKYYRYYPTIPMNMLA